VVGSKKEVVLRPEGPSIEARRVKSGVGVLGEKQPAPSHQLVGLGNAVSTHAGSGAQPQPKLNLVHFS